MSNHTAGGHSITSTKKLVYSAMGIALALVTSYLKLWKMPMGGSVTLLSMLFSAEIPFEFLFSDTIPRERRNTSFGPLFPMTPAGG